MEKFSYKAVSSDGKEKKGTIDAQTRNEVIKQLKEEGLIPVNISQQSFLDRDIQFSFLHKRKIKSRDFCVFCRQFSSILRAGVSVVSALEMLSEQTENKTLRLAIKGVQSGVEKGETLSDSMKREECFPPLLVNMVAAGEMSGSMEKAIDRMALQFEKESRLKGMVKKAMIYPIILCCVAVGVLIVMMTFVIPKFVAMFDEIQTEIPTFTKMIIGMSNFVTNYWYVMIIIAVAIVFVYKAYAKSESGRHHIDSFKLKVPIFGKLATKSECASFSRTLATLIVAGMPMMDALSITADTMINVLYKDALLKVRNGVGLGIELSSQLKSAKVFPPMVVHMTGIGEQTGNIEEMLNNVAGYYEEEVEITTQQITALMEPLIIIVMALIVGVLVIAIYSPMVSLYNSIG